MSSFSSKTRRIALLALITIGVTSIWLTGCNTTAGIGKDIEAAGDAIEEEAEENKRY